MRVLNFGAYLLITILFPLFLSADIIGVYNVTGWDPYENHAYSGKATFKKDKNNVLQIKWTYSDGSEYQGTGLINGEILSTVFVDPTVNTFYTGVQVYHISENLLEGNWVLLNQSLLGHEKLIKASNP